MQRLELSGAVRPLLSSLGVKGLMSPHLTFPRVRHIAFTDSTKIRAKYCEGFKWNNVLRNQFGCFEILSVEHAESVVITYA